jgi:autotransporter adhesin
MKKFAILLTAAVLAASAYATQPGNNGGGNGGCGVGQQTNGCGAETPPPPVVIVGPQGPKGDTGPAGRDGRDGTNGIDGQSIKGDKGDQGENAPDAVTVQQMTSTVQAAQAATQSQINGLREEIHGVAKSAYSGVAAAMALQMPAINPAKPDALVMRVGVGAYKGQSAVGITFRKSNKAGDWSLTGGVSRASGGTAVALGVEHAF